MQWTFAVDGGGDKTSGKSASASPLAVEEAQGGYLGFEIWMVKEKTYPAKPFHTAASSGKISFKNRFLHPTAPALPLSPLYRVALG